MWGMANKFLREAALDQESLQRLLDRDVEWQAYILAGIKKFTANNVEYERARAILGSDFISPDEVATARGLTYTDKQLAEFGNTLPSVEELRWCRDNNMMLVPGPPTAMSLLQIRALNPTYFYRQGLDNDSTGWYDDVAQSFARHEDAKSFWIAFCKEAVPNSQNMSLSEQLKLMVSPMILPSIAEAVWCLTAYKAVRDICLMPSDYIRTCSLDSQGDPVDVGAFDLEGLDVSSGSGDYEGEVLGISGARTFR
jgi:hypothetical protein